MAMAEGDLCTVTTAGEVKQRRSVQAKSIHLQLNNPHLERLERHGNGQALAGKLGFRSAPMTLH